MTSTAFERGSAGLQMQVFLSPTRTIDGELTFSPVSSTLFTGRQEAVLVDAQFYRDDVEALGDLIERSGRRLTHIYVTHAHFDHYFGAGEIAGRFPGSKVVALPSVVASMAARHEREAATVTAMFGARAVAPGALPEPMEGDVLDLEGHALQAIDVGQGDIAPSTVVYARDLAAVVVGDVAYNGVHMMLGLTGPQEWARWLDSLDAIERLDADWVVAGHKRPGLPDAASTVLSSTKTYIQDFAEAAAREPSAEAIVAAMEAMYPGYANHTTLRFSASAAVRRR